MVNIRVCRQRGAGFGAGKCGPSAEMNRTFGPLPPSGRPFPLLPLPLTLPPPLVQSSQGGGVELLLLQFGFDSSSHPVSPRGSTTPSGAPDDSSYGFASPRASCIHSGSGLIQCDRTVE